MQSLDSISQANVYLFFKVFIPGTTNFVVIVLFLLYETKDKGGYIPFVELVIAEVALQHNLIPIEIYSALIVMAMVTTFMFPFVMKIIIKKNHIT